MIDLPPFELITNKDQWSGCLHHLRAEPRLAIDLEANSMFAYREQVCLIQISTPTHDYIIDPLTIADLSGLGQLIANPAVEKIFHAAEYDLILLKRQYGWEIKNLFDTMWAARILGYPRYGLASLLEEFYAINLNKRYQKSNWCQRPLKPEQLAYAQHDTHFLFQLRDRLAGEIIASGRELEAAESFSSQTKITLNDNGFNPDGFWSINGVHDMSRRQQAILKEIYIFRDEEARKRDLPVFKIFNDRTLLEIAQSKPRNMRELADIHGMSHGQVRRYGRSLLEVIDRGLQAPLPVHPKRQTKRHPDIVITRYEKLHTWRKERAISRGVESDVIISRDALWEIATTNPQNIETLSQLESVGSWRCQTYGHEILNLLKNSDK